MKNTNSHPDQANHQSRRTSSILTMVLFIACIGFILFLVTQQIARLFPTLSWLTQWVLGGVILLLIGIGWLAFFAIEKKLAAKVAVRGKNCSACPPLNRTIPLIGKEQFPSLIRQIQEKMRAGVLVEYHPVSQTSVDAREQSFSQVSPDGPWDDRVLHYFRCTHCGQAYELNVDTYRGSHAAWTPIAENA